MRYTEARQILSEAIEQLYEGAYVPKEREARRQRKGSRKLLRQAIARGDRNAADEWRRNIRDAEAHIRRSSS